MSLAPDAKVSGTEVLRVTVVLYMVYSLEGHMTHTACYLIIYITEVLPIYTSREFGPMCCSKVLSLSWKFFLSY